MIRAEHDGLPLQLSIDFSRVKTQYIEWSGGECGGFHELSQDAWTPMRAADALRAIYRTSQDAIQNQEFPF